MDDLDAVAVGVVKVQRSRAVAVCLRARLQRDAAALEKRSPPVDIVRAADNQSEMIERPRADTQVGPYMASTHVAPYTASL
jgi:hypothetical protein